MPVSNKEILFLTKNLAVLVKAGVPMSEVLATVSEQVSPALKKALKSVEKDVINGSTLAKAMSKHPKIFDKFYVSIVGAGESSGTLEENLKFMSEQLGKNYNLRQKIQGALFYPGLVTLVAVVVGTLTSWWVLPKLTEMFMSFDVELPLSTKILFWIANFMKAYGLFVVIGMVVIIVLSTILYQVKSIKLFIDSIFIRIPLIGEIATDGEMGRFSRNLGLLLSSGLSVIDAFEISIETIGNERFRRDLREVKASVSEGKSIWESMDNKRYPEFSKLATRMVGVGERSGSLSEMLMYLSDFYENEIDTISKNMSNLLEPVLLIVIGLVVAFVTLAIVSPVYQLMGGIHG